MTWFGFVRPGAVSCLRGKPDPASTRKHGEIIDVSSLTILPGFINSHVDGALASRNRGIWAQAGMTPMQIIVASTLNGARVCNLDQELGTLTRGKVADLFATGDTTPKMINPEMAFGNAPA